jgi:hypothetical protein
MNYSGQHLSSKEGAVMVWSGLRGAIALAMGLIVDIEPGIPKSTSSQVMFHVGGIAALTMVINSVTTGPLLKALDMVKSDTMTKRVCAKLKSQVDKKIQATFESELLNEKDARFHGANSELVYSMVPLLKSAPPESSESPLRQHYHSHLTFLNEQPVQVELRLFQVLREVFLRIVQSRYWQGIQDGVIPRQLMVCRVLLHSTEQSMDSIAEGLKDWDIISTAMCIDVHSGTTKATASSRLLSKLVNTWPFKYIPQLRRASIDFQTMMTVFVALSYIEAHTFAQNAIPESLGRDDAVGVRVLKQVIQESSLQVQKASTYIENLPPEFVEMSKSEMLARRLLRQHIAEVQHKQEGGFLTSKEAETLCAPCHHALRDIADMPMNFWRDRLPSRDNLDEHEEETEEEKAMKEPPGKDTPPLQPPTTTQPAASGGTASGREVPIPSSTHIGFRTALYPADGAVSRFGIHIRQ